MKLREAPIELEVLLEKYNAEETTDEERIALEKELEQVEIEVNRKCDAIANYISQYSGEASFIKAEIDRLTRLMKQRENKAEGLKRYLSNCLLRLNLRNLDTAFHKFYFTKSTVLHVKEDALVPAEYCKVIPSKLEPQKSLLKDALSKGLQIDGVWVEAKENLQIK